MKPRDRVLAALNHKEPDRVPIDLGGNVSSMHIQAYTRLADYLGLELKGVVIDKVQQIVWPDEEVLKIFDIDFRRIPMSGALYAAGGEDRSDDPSGRPYFIDEWGIKWGKNPLYYDMIDHPLKNATIDDLEKYSWPDPHNPARYEGLEKAAKKLYEETDYALVGQSLGASLFELSWWLRGFEKFTVDMYRNPEFADKLLDTLLEIFLGLYEEYLGILDNYIQLIQFGDDYGGQNGPIISPILFRRYIKPRLKKLYSYVHSRTKAKILHHTCGSVYTLMDDLIDVGIDVLNPVQPSAAMMDSERLKKEFGSRISFHGGVDIQKILPFVGKDEVSDVVRKVLKAFAPGGGYIFTGSHNIQPDTPPENVVAMFEAARKFGVYPII